MLGLPHTYRAVEAKEETSDGTLQAACKVPPEQSGNDVELRGTGIADLRPVPGARVPREAGPRCPGCLRPTLPRVASVRRISFLRDVLSAHLWCPYSEEGMHRPRGFGLVEPGISNEGHEVDVWPAPGSVGLGR